MPAGKGFKYKYWFRCVNIDFLVSKKNLSYFQYLRCVYAELLRGPEEVTEKLGLTVFGELGMIGRGKCKMGQQPDLNIPPFS